MSFISDTLEPGEHIVLQAQISRIAYLNALFMLAAMMHPLQLMRLSRTELALTDRRIIGITGIGKRTLLKVPLKDIDSVTVQKGIFGWLFDYGTIKVNTKDGRRIAFRAVVWPLVFQQEAHDAVEVAVLGKKLSDYAPQPF